MPAPMKKQHKPAPPRTVYLWDKDNEPWKQMLAIKEMAHNQAARVVHCKRAPYDVYVGRPSPWGNPYSAKPTAKTMTELVADRATSVRLFAVALANDRAWQEKVKQELAGKTLGCWCKPGVLCHGHVLAHVANGGTL